MTISAGQLCGFLRRDDPKKITPGCARNPPTTISIAETKNPAQCDSVVPNLSNSFARDESAPRIPSTSLKQKTRPTTMTPNKANGVEYLFWPGPYNPKAPIGSSFSALLFSSLNLSHSNARM